jgi:hypothetical protein
MKIKSYHPCHPPCNGEFEATIHKSTDGGLYVSIPNFGCSRTYYNVDEVHAVAELLQEHGAQLAIPCKYCNDWTLMLETRQCDNCWEVASRVDNMTPELIYRIILDKSELFQRFRTGLQANDPDRMLILHMAFAAGYDVQCLHQDGSWREEMITPGLWYRVHGRSLP